MKPSRIRMALATLACTLTLMGQAPAVKAPSTPGAKQAAPAPAAKEWKQLSFTKLGEIKLPEVTRYTLANGLKLFLVEDHRLPLIDGSAMVRTGSRWEPAEKTGLAGVFGQVMRTGGTRAKTGDQMDEELEAIAASVESGMGGGSGSASFSCQKGQEDKVIALFADMLMNPEFRQDKIDLAKTNARTGIARRNDQVGGIADREFRKLLYGEGNPYVTQTEYWTIEAITRADLQAWHSKYYHPNNTMLAVWGDFDAGDMKARFEKAFAAWKPAARLDFPAIPQTDAGRRAGLHFIRKDDVNQTNLRIGHLGGRLDDPDFFATSVMAEILCAGGFSSRSMKRIRSEMGLAYTAAGSWSANFDYPGVFAIRVDTKSESTAKALEATLQLIREIREKEVSDEELKQAKESILNGFVFNFQSVGQIVSRLMTYEYYHYPADFLDKYKANVEKITKADVLRVAQRQLQPDQLTVLAVGKDKDFDKPLTQVVYAGGRVNTIDLTIPDKKPGAAVAGAGAADPQAVQRGRAILARAQDFAGGLEKLKALKDLEVSAKGKVPAMSLDITLKTVNVFPDVWRQEIASAMFNQATFFDGTNGWSQSPQGLQDMGDAQKKDARASGFRHLTNLLAGTGSPTVVFEKKDGENDVLLITKDDMTVRLLVDLQGKVVKKAYRGASMMGPADMEELLSDYRLVNGVQIPYKTVVNANGQPFLEAEATEVKTNTGVDAAKLGEKPK